MGAPKNYTVEDLNNFFRKTSEEAQVQRATRAAREEEYRKANAPKTREQLQTIVDGQTANVDSIYNANKGKWESERTRNTPFFGGGMAHSSQFYAAATSNEQKQLEAAQLELKNARKALDTYTESDQKRDIAAGKEKSWHRELRDGFKNTNINEIADIVTFDMHSAGNKAKINRAMEKRSRGEEISEIEQAMIDALGATRQSERYVADNGGGTAWNSIGSGLRQSVGFMARTVLTGGSLGITRELIKQGAGKAALTMLGREALRSPVYSMASDFQNKTADQYTINADGSVKMDNATSTVERLWKSYATSLTEGVSEQVGGFIPIGFVGKGLRKVAPKLLGSKIGGAVEKGVDYAAHRTKGFRETLKKTTNYNGTIDEYFEEQFNNVVEPLLTGEPERIADNFSAKQQWITLGSVAIMGSAMHSASIPNIARDEIRSGNLRGKRNKAIGSIENEAMRQGVYDAIKKGVTVEDRAKMMSSLDWGNATREDVANAVDAYSWSTRLDLLRGFNEAEQTQELTARKINLYNDTFTQGKNEQTGMLHELGDKDGNRYFLLNGSLDEQTPDGTVFVRNLATGQAEQKSSTLLFPTSEPTTYEQGLTLSAEQITEQVSDEANEREMADADQDAIDSNVAAVSYTLGDQVQLSDGRSAQFITYAQDGAGTVRVAFIDPETGDQESADIPRSQIMGLASQEDDSTSMQESSSSDQIAEVQGTGEQVQASEVTTPREVPLRKDGQPDYDMMPADMFLEEYSKVVPREEALADLRDLHVDLQKSINRIQSSKVTSLNKKADNRAKLTQMQTKVDEIAAVLEANSVQAEQSPLPVQASQAESQNNETPSKTQKAPLREAMLALGDYVSIEDYILRDIASGLKFGWSDDGVSRGLASEFGFVGNIGEQRRRIGLIRADGTTPQVYAESLVDLVGTDIPAFPGIEYDEIRNTVNDTLLSISSPAQAARRAVELHTDNFDDHMSNYLEGEREIYRMEAEEYDAALDLLIAELTDEDFEAINDLFEEESLSLIPKRDNNGHNKNDTRGTAIVQDEINQAGQHQSQGDGDHGGRGLEVNDSRSQGEEGQNEQITDPIFEATTPEEKHRAVVVYVDQLNELSGSDAVVFSKLEQLPDAVAFEFEAQWRAEPTRETPGVTIGTKVYIYAPHIKDTADLEMVFNHEIAAHRNVLLALGKDRKAEAELYSAVVDGVGVSKMLQVIEDPDFEAIADRYFENPVYDKKVMLGKEFVGYFTNKHFDKKEYSKVGTGELLLNLSEGITVEDVINIINTANNKGDEQRIIIENSGDRFSQSARDAAETRNLGQDRTGRAPDFAGGGSDMLLAPEDTAGGLSGISENTAHPKNRSGSFAESKPGSEREIRRDDIRTDGGTEQTNSPTDAQRDLDNNRNNSDNDLRLQQIILSSIRTGEVLESTNLGRAEDIRDAHSEAIIPIEGSERRGGERGFERDRPEAVPGANTSGTTDAGLIEGEGERSLEGQDTTTQGITRKGPVLVEQPTDTAISREAQKTDVRLRASDSDAEMASIKADAIAKDKFLKAPNGEPTNLTEHQWLQVRTEAFKEWFGDWEKAARIEKLRKAENVAITGNEITPSEDMKEYRRNALAYGKTIKGEYDNKDTGLKIIVSNTGLDKLLSHDKQSIQHIQSIASIPALIENSVFISEIQPEKESPKFDSYKYFVSGLKIQGEAYTVKIVVGEKNGDRYYDHALTEIEKGELLSKIDALSIAFNADNSPNTRGLKKVLPLSEFKDKRLISILQNSASKVVDANGEPQVVYHGTRKEFYEFDTNKSSATGSGSFFTTDKNIADEYMGKADNRFVSPRLVEAFINLKNPFDYDANSSHKDLLKRYIERKTNQNESHRQKIDNEREFLEQNFDGEIRRNRKNDSTTFVVFDANQIKSAIGNIGTFDNNATDIRYDEIRSLSDTVKEIEIQHAHEQIKDVQYINPAKRKAQAVEQLQKLAQKFNTPIAVVNSKRELPENLRYASRDRQFSGLYHKQTGAVYFVVDEIRDADDATATFLHEVVSHKGIDGLLGEQNAKKFYHAVFDSLPKKEQDAMLATANGDKVIAGDEFVAQMAEGDVTPSVMHRIIAAVRRFFREVLGVPLTVSDNDIRYILWKSKNNLERAGSVSEVFSTLSADKAIRKQIYRPDEPLLDKIEDVAVRYRSKDKPKSTEHRVSGFKNTLKSNAVQVQETLQDSTIKVHLLQTDIEKGGGAITPEVNVYESMNHLDSRAKSTMDRYDRQFITPFVENLKKLDEKGIQYAEVSDYMSAKHSIERHESGINAISEEQDGKWTMEVTTTIVENFEKRLSKQELDGFWNMWRKATDEILKTAELSGRMSAAQAAKIRSRGWQYYVPLRGKDWNFEDVVNMQESFYYDYSGYARGKSADKKVVNIRAKGRTTKADDPIAALQNMAHTEIYLSELNNVNLKLLRLAQKYPERTDLFAVKDQWFARVGQDEWHLTENKPDKKIIESSNEARKAKYRAETALKKATTAAERAKFEREIETAEGAIIVKQDVPQEGYTGAIPKAHEVVVMKDGKKYVVELKDPEVAAAINYRSGSFQGWLSKWPGRVTRVMSQLATSKNPLFVIPNFIRDIQHAMMYNLVDSDGDAVAFFAYAMTSWKVLDRSIRGVANPLTEAEQGTLNILDKTDRKRLATQYSQEQVQDTLYELFSINGGETGYVHILDPVDYQRKLRKASKRSASKLSVENALPKGFKALNDGVDYLANISENITRFATFMSQIDKGSTVFDAVSYAKNITVNFNRKGKYSKGLGSLFMFFNAGIQGAVNTYSLWGNKKGKSAKVMAAQRAKLVGAFAVLAATGFVMTMLLYDMLSAMIGDDEEEFTVSDYERRTNLIIPTGNGTYMKIPIPILFRPFYSLGVQAYDWMIGRTDGQDVAWSFLGNITDAMLPIQVDISINPERDGWQGYKAFIPSPVKPLFEIGYNQNFAGRPINKESKYAPAGTPDSQMGMPYSASWAKWISETLNNLGGGNQFTPAGVDEHGKADTRNWLDISPSSLEHIATSYTGGVGKMINDISKMLAGQDGGKTKIPIADRFYGKAYEKDPSREYYDLKSAIERVRRNNKLTREQGSDSAWFSPEELDGKTREGEIYYNQLRQNEKRIKNIRERMQEIDTNSAEYQDLDKLTNRLQRQFTKQINDQRN